MEETKNSWSFKDFIVVALLTIVIVLPIRIFLAQPFIVSGSSMLPTFETGQYLIVDQVSYNFNDPDRGDIIIFRFKETPGKFLIKRIIGLPGETVKIEGNDVFVKMVDSDEFVQIEEEYVVVEKGSTVEKSLGEEEYFVLGDNRLNSLDSRYFGAIEKDLIIGRAWLRLFPLNKIDYLPGKFEI